VNTDRDHIKILHALRCAAALRREPGPITPDGRERFHTLGELEMEGRLDIGPYTNAAARGLRQKGLVIGRTMHTVTRYAISDTGAAWLAALEEKAGATELVAAELAFDQAQYDWEQATERRVMAQRAINKARTRAERPGSINLLLDAMRENAR
jgi:hypothetical protein